MRYLELFAILLASFVTTGALACSGIGSTPLNESYNLDPNTIRQCIQDGYDPPKDWIVRGGTGAERQSGANEMGAGAKIVAGRKTAKESVPFYESTGCPYAGFNSKPGGETVGGALFACNASGSGGSSFGPPDINLIPPIPFMNVLANCMSGLFGSMTSSGGNACVSGGLNLCGFGSIGGNICAGTNGVRINGTAAMTGVDSISISGNQPLGPAGLTGNGVDSAVRGPLSVAGDTILRLPDGTSVAVAAGSVITTTTDNWVQIRDGGGTLLSEYDLNGFSAPAVLDVPTAGVDLDPGLANADNYAGQSANPYDNSMPSCYMSRSPC